MSETKPDCSCAEVYGEDPNCIKHGRGTTWAKANPDICELVDRATRAEAALAEAVGALEPFARRKMSVGGVWKPAPPETPADFCVPTSTPSDHARAASVYARLKEGGSFRPQESAGSTPGGASSDHPGAWREALERVNARLDLARPAFTNLTTHQRQLDQDGVEVGVSRQAVDETVDAILAAADIALAALPPAPNHEGGA